MFLRLIPLLLVFLSFIFRLSLLYKGPFNIDCLDLVIKIEETLKTGTLQYMYGSGYPLYVLISTLTNLTGKLLGVSDPFIIVNFQSALFTSLAVFFVYGIGKLLTKNELGGLFSSLIFIFNPAILSESLYGTSHAPALFFLTGTVYFLLKYINQQTSINLITASVFYGMLGATRLQDMTFMFIPILTFFFASKGPRKIFRHMFIFFAISAAIGFAFYSQYLLGPLSSAYLLQLQKFKFDSLGVSGAWFYWDSIFKMWAMLLEALSPLGAIFAFIGLWALQHRFKNNAFFLFLWIFFPCLMLIFIATTVMRFLVLPLTAIIIAAGCGCSFLWGEKRRKKVIVFISLVILIWGTTLPYYPLFYFRHKNDAIASYARKVRQITGPNAVIIAHDDKRFFSYFGGLETLHRPANYFFIEDEKLWKFKTKVDELLANQTPVYITALGLYAYDPEEKFSSFLKKHYKMEYVGTELYEDWHLGGMYNRIFGLPLIRVRPL